MARAGATPPDLPLLDPGAPAAVVDLAAFDANADDLVRRAGGRPIRVASKSLRCRALLERTLARPGFAGVMAYSLAEAIWLVRTGTSDDVFVAYPSADLAALRTVATDAALRRAITLAVDAIEQLELWAGALGSGAGVRVAVDVDAGLRLGPLRIGARRSPVWTPSHAAAVARHAVARGFVVVGALFYDAQVAGVADASAAVRWVKRRSLAQLARRRTGIVAALREVAPLEFVNVGGTGSLDRFGADPVITEVAAGSGLYGPALFDGYDGFAPRAALWFATPVVRRPGRGLVTVFAGGYAASGAAGPDRLPRPASGLRLLGLEGAGEVQTPVRGRRVRRLRVGDPVWFRPAKAGEVLERFDAVHLADAARVVDVVPTYRGEGRNFG